MDPVTASFGLLLVVASFLVCAWLGVKIAGYFDLSPLLGALVGGFLHIFGLVILVVIGLLVGRRRRPPYGGYAGYLVLFLVPALAAATLVGCCDEDFCRCHCHRHHYGSAGPPAVKAKADCKTK